MFKVKNIFCFCLALPKYIYNRTGLIEGIKKLKCDLSSGKHIDNNHVFINLYKSKADMKKRNWTKSKHNNFITIRHACKGHNKCKQYYIWLKYKNEHVACQL